MIDSTQTISVLLIGAGGNGSAFFESLVRIDAGLKALGCPGLDVTVLDDDVVSESNVVRQGFFPHEVDTHKAIALVHRANLCHGLGWQALARRFTQADAELVRWADLIVTAVDSVSARRAVASFKSVWCADRTWWLDIGVEKKSGQVVLGLLSGGTPYPNVFDVYPDLWEAEDTHTEPSCSAAESLARQDLLLNPTAAFMAGNLLWQALRSSSLERTFLRFDLASSTVTSGRAAV